MDHLEIPFGSQIAIRSKFNQKFLGYRHQNQQIASCFPPPTIYSREKITEPLDMALKFRIVAREAEKTNLVTEGSKVFLINSSTEQYLTCTSKGELKFDKKSAINEEMNKTLYKSASWSISFAGVQKSLTSPSRNPLSPYDLVVLKSVYGAYLTIHPTTFNCEAQQEMDEVRSVWNIQSINSISIPQWFFQKPSFSKFLKLEWQIERTSNRQKRNLRTFTPEVQEALLVEDLIDIMLGFQGSYIKHRQGKEASFVIEPHLQTPSCNIALAQLTERILQLPSHYQRLMRFISQLQLKESTLCQSLCDGLRKLINQYKDGVMQLDQEAEKGLTLQMMWFEVQNTLKVMRAMSDLVNLASNLKGGQLLTCLLKLLNQNTDDHVIGIYRFMFNKLIALYVNLLSMWLYEGVIDDRYGQFMVKMEEKTTTEWNFWQERFSLRTDQIPSLLDHDAQRILVTGKYLNILRACNKQIKHPCAGQIEANLEYHLSKQNFTQPIQKAYDWANQQLLHLIFTECKLNEVLQSFKGYYFLRFGDLFIHFLDAAEEELSMQKKSKTDMRGRPFSVQKLQNLFQLNVRISSSANDPFKEEVSCRLDNSTLFEQVHRIKTLESEVLEFNFIDKPFIKKDSRYIDFVTLDFKCGFPLNLILNRKSMSKYQAMFRLMLRCKFLQRQLGACWVKLQAIKQTDLKCVSKAYILNHKMLNFIKSIVYYLTEEVVEQNWFKLSADLKKVKNFEEIIQCHDSFLNNCLKESLLTNSKLLPILNAEIGNTINNYFFLKGYLANIEEVITPIKQSMSTDPKERRESLKEIRTTIEDLLVENDFNELVSRSALAFTDVIGKFVREISQKTGKQENHLLRLGEMLNEQNYVQKKEETYFLS